MISPDKIKILGKIGKGSYASVFIGKNKDTSQLYAIKKVSKQHLKNSGMSTYYNNEIYILKHIIPHPNIIKFYGLLETKNSYYSIFNYCNGHSLKESLQKYIQKYGKPFPESYVRYIVTGILNGLIHLNKQNIIHRDIKADNVLLNYKNSTDQAEINILNAEIIIIDFGFARYLDKDELASSIIGTPLFMEPSILKFMADPGTKDDYNKTLESMGGFYDKKVDIWSLGVITYQLLFERFPFIGTNFIDLYNNIKKQNFNLPKNKNLTVSKNCIMFLQNILFFDYRLRPVAEQLIADKWITQSIDENEKYKINEDFILNLNLNPYNSNGKRENVRFIDYWKKVEKKNFLHLSLSSEFNAFNNNKINYSADKRTMKKSESYRSLNSNRKNLIDNFIEKIAKTNRNSSVKKIEFNLDFNQVKNNDCNKKNDINVVLNGYNTCSNKKNDNNANNCDRFQKYFNLINSTENKNKDYYFGTFKKRNCNRNKINSHNESLTPKKLENHIKIVYDDEK